MAIGKGNTEEACRTFNVNLVIHLLIAIAIKRFDVTTIMVFIMLEKDMIQAMTENNP